MRNWLRLTPPVKQKMETRDFPAEVRVEAAEAEGELAVVRVVVTT